jgi:hypothetical protein
MGKPQLFSYSCLVLLLGTQAAQRLWRFLSAPWAKRFARDPGPSAALSRGRGQESSGPRSPGRRAKLTRSVWGLADSPDPMRRTRRPPLVGRDFPPRPAGQPVVGRCLRDGSNPRTRGSYSYSERKQRSACGGSVRRLGPNGSRVILARLRRCHGGRTESSGPRSAWPRAKLTRSPLGARGLARPNTPNADARRWWGVFSRAQPPAGRGTLACAMAHPSYSWLVLLLGTQAAQRLWRFLSGALAKRFARDPGPSARCHGPADRSPAAPVPPGRRGMTDRKRIGRCRPVSRGLSGRLTGAECPANMR